MVQTKQRCRYQLLAGGHIENDANGVERRYRSGLDIGMGPGVFESVDANLAVRWPEKFLRLHADQWTQRTVQQAAEDGFDPARSNTGPTSPPVPSVQPVTRAPQTKEEFFAVIERMTLKELQGVAIEREVETKGLKTREEVLRAIKAEADD